MGNGSPHVVSHGEPHSFQTWGETHSSAADCAASTRITSVVAKLLVALIMVSLSAPHGMLRAALLLAVHVAGVWLFSSGFFLRRVELPNVSVCDEAPPGAVFAADASRSRGCWMPRRYARVAVVVVDALRYDFMSPHAAMHHDDADADGNRAGMRQAFAPRMPRLAAALARRDCSAVGMRFIADAPTVTAQRLKGLTTGSLPTFLDVRRNFASSVVEEDTWVRQLAGEAG